tara:strand:+ start:677 stop:898 length:222 start_codon:yes stop_codon:yes gene_type:complete
MELTNIILDMVGLLTFEENKLRLKLEDQLTYGSGITPSQWEELIPMRKKWLIYKGKNPAEWNLDSRNLNKKMK